VRAVCGRVLLDFERREDRPAAKLAADWEQAAGRTQATDPGAAELFRCWAAWARDVALRELRPWPAPVTVLDWGGVLLVALPGEPFAASALSLRRRLPAPVVVLGYADGCPGYVPPCEEYEAGGYEVEEAHRYYGMPATFAPGSAEPAFHG
jgi:neutral ceramidase